MDLMDLRLQKVLRENYTDFIDSLRLCGIDVEHGVWTSDTIEANARVGAHSLIRYVSREGVPARYRQNFLRVIAENLDEEGSTSTMALIYTAYEWDKCFPSYAIIQHMVDPALFREYCAALQKNLRSYLSGYFAGAPNIV